MAIDRTTRSYVDFDLNFTKHPVTRDISKLTGLDAIKRSVKNLILTNFYERPFQPTLGSGVAFLLFEPITNITAYEIRSAIFNVIGNYEPRVQLTDVHVIPKPEQNAFECTIFFYSINSPQPEVLEVFLTLVR